MNLLYVAPTKIEMNQLDGVAKKILDHAKVFSDKYDVILLYRDTKNVMLYRFNENRFEILGKGISKFEILKEAFRVIQRENISCCYIRYPNSEPLFISLLKKMKKKNICVVIEIPTYPYDQEGKESIKGRIINIVDRYYRRKLHCYVSRIITYSDDDYIFGIKTIKTVNGLDYDRVQISKKASENDKVIHLCGVATFHRIHGYDRLIEGMKLYYNAGGKRDIIFDIVGYGDNDILQEYKKIANDKNLKDRIIFHGRLNGKALDDIYDMASIGVNSLAIHRQNLEKESTLKTREYAAKGLPILSSSFVDAFDEADNEQFVCRVSPDDSPIKIDKVIEFYENLVLNRKIQDLKEQIRNRSRVICDMPITLRPVIEYLKNQ